MTLPILLYRGLFNLFGLRTYLPYQLPVDVLHFTAAALLRVVMRRAGVGPWIATAAAGLYALFGSGYEDLAWGFQVTFVGALSSDSPSSFSLTTTGPSADGTGSAVGRVLKFALRLGLGDHHGCRRGGGRIGAKGRAVAAFHTVPLALDLWRLVAPRGPALPRRARVV